MSTTGICDIVTAQGDKNLWMKQSSCLHEWRVTTLDTDFRKRLQNAAAAAATAEEKLQSATIDGDGDSGSGGGKRQEAVAKTARNRHTHAHTILQGQRPELRRK